MGIEVGRSDDLPAVIVTGASGLVGRNFINAARDRFYIYAIARRGQHDAGVPVHHNIRWQRCDIADGDMVSRLIDSIAEESTIDFLFHFAGYYDFDYRNSPHYHRTNVLGTRHVLQAAERLRVRRFVFSSSLAVSDFSDPHRVVDEHTPPDAAHAYARSKREAEEEVASFSGKFPCTIARLAAVFSDWCEYAPLCVLLNGWLGGGLRTRIVAGSGETAIPYIHVNDLNRFWLQVVERHEQLGDLDILVAGPNGCVSHNELYAAATQGIVEGAGRAIHVPVWLATAGVALWRLFGQCIGRVPFERPWMLRYIDRKMTVDARATHRRLGWTLKPRFHVMRRMLFLIENMKRDPLAWERRNLAMEKRAVREWPSLKIYNAMISLREGIVEGHVAYLTAEENRNIYPNYQGLDLKDLRLRAEILYQMLESSIRLGDHLSILTYVNYLARWRFREGYACEELKGSLEHLAVSIEKALKKHPGLEELHKMIQDEIGITMQLILDEVEDAYDNLTTEGEVHR